MEPMTKTNLTVAYVSDLATEFVSEGDLKIYHYDSVDLFNESGRTFDLLFIGRLGYLDSKKLIKMVRMDNENKLKPIFILKTEVANEDEIDLSDGRVDSLSEAICLTNEINDRLDVLPNNISTRDPDTVLLYYIYSRPEKVLKTILDWRMPRVVRYPLAELFYEDDFDLWPHLMHLQSKNILKSEELIAKIQTCPFCNSALLAFQAYCPNCSSINIKLEKFLHCFTCGHIARQKNFFQDEGLLCPRCFTKLRHIGDDYDRPLEDHVCDDCTHSFMETEIAATCLVCNKKTDTQNLVTRELYNFRLRKEGIRRIRGQQIDMTYYLKDHFNYVVPEYFKLSSKWYMTLRRRHKKFTFSILVFSIKNFNEIEEQVGPAMCSKVVDQLYKRLRTQFRESDICTCVENEYIFFLLPETNDSGCTAIQSKIKKFITETNSENDLLITSAVA